MAKAKKYTDPELAQINEQWQALIEVQNVTFVIAEPSRAALNTLTNALTSLGVENIETVSTAKDALESGGQIDHEVVFITELKLADSDGIQLIKHIRNDRKMAASKIILVTAEKNKQKLILAIKAGVNAIIAKPVNTETFQAKLKEMDVV